jgi:DNA-binding NarL/FixJ family response regulator
VTLTRSQVRVLVELSRDGATNRQIAERLGVTEQNIKFHLMNIMALVGCKTRTALALWWVREGRSAHIGKPT